MNSESHQGHNNANPGCSTPDTLCHTHAWLKPSKAFIMPEAQLSAYHQV